MDFNNLPNNKHVHAYNMYIIYIEIHMHINMRIIYIKNGRKGAGI
jgi:hypothetical protein